VPRFHSERLLVYLIPLTGENRSNIIKVNTMIAMDIKMRIISAVPTIAFNITLSISTTFSASVFFVKLPVGIHIIVYR
ncbi:MAG: hypothetical protein Q8Q92_03010, partial [bacterium]|nr:hypothetical protein [bacterium]